MKLTDYIGEATSYDKKLMLERKDPISWLKSVSAFANTRSGKLLYGVNDSGELIGLENAEKDAEDISEAIKTQMDPIPQTNLSIHEEDGKRFVVVEIFAGEETPYYVRHKGSLTAYVRIGNESVRADPLELNRLVLKGSRRSWDSLPSVYKRKDFSFEVLYATYHEKTKLSFEESDFQSFGLVTDDGHLTNAGALFADKSPVRHSRVFCTRWNGLDKAHGLMESFDDDEYFGGLLSLLNASKDFVRRNRRMMWRKTPDSRIDYPEYPDQQEPSLVTTEVTTEVTTQVTTQVTTEVKRLVIALIGEMRSDALMASIGIKQKEDFRTRYLKPAIVNGFVEMTQPDSPRSPTQKYRLTEKGVALAQQQEAN